MDQKGFLNTLIVVLALVIIAGVAGYFILVNKRLETPSTTSTMQTPTPKQDISPIPSTTSDRFDEKLIIKSVTFTDSAGELKRFIIVKTGGNIGDITGKAEAYIANADFTKNTAIQITALSSENAGLGYVGDDVLVSISPGPGKKFILVSYQVADSFPTFLLDEKGILISTNVVGNAYELVKDKCQCGFGFDSWKDQDEFYVEVRTAAGGDYRVLVDANTGKIIGLPQGKK